MKRHPSMLVSILIKHYLNYYILLLLFCCTLGLTRTARHLDLMVRAFASFIHNFSTFNFSLKFCFYNINKTALISLNWLKHLLRLAKRQFLTRHLL